MKTGRAAIVVALCMASVVATPARAAGWPDRPIRLIVSAATGSSIDIPARVVAEKLKERLGQPLVVDNRPQAGGIVSVDAAAKAPPDGHTLLWSFNGPLANAPHLYAKLPYDPLKDLVPVVMTTGQPFVLAVAPALGATTVKEFLALARASPGKLNYSSLGNASGTHLTMEMLKAEAKVSLVHVPYGGGPASAAALAAGEVQASFQVPALVQPHAKSGRVRLLAVSTARRFPLMHELPTVAESGVPGFDSDSWNGILVPAGTPRAIVERLNREVNAILRLEEVKALLAANLIRVDGGTPGEFAQVLRAHSARWGAIIRQTGARVD